ncbi:metal-sulfur cluster assembly factor [Mesorhizobium sp. A556]
MNNAELRESIAQTLEAIVDPCSIASGAPAGLVSMGLVGDINIMQATDSADVEVTLYITEPGCMMAALFQITAKQKLEQIEGVGSVDVKVDYGHIWGPEQMTPEYRERLREYRSCQEKHMQALHASA